MRMIAGAVLVLASMVAGAGYEVAKAENAHRGGWLTVFAWGLGIAGIGLLAIGWRESDNDDRSEGGKKEKSA